MTQEIKDILRKTTIFPILIDNYEIIEGTLFNRPNLCLNCKDMECYQDNFTHTSCRHGFRIFDIDIPNEQLKFIGVITSVSKKKLPLQLQKKYLSKTIDEARFTQWAQSIKQSISELKEDINKKQRQYIDGFHDITPTINLIIRNAEYLINKSNGISMDDKFENSSHEIQTLYKSAELLNQHLLFMSYLTNPESIRYGQKRQTVVYKIIDKMCKIFKQNASLKHINLQIKGKSYNNPKIHDSFGILIFILLENAIKYSYQNQDVIINIKDLQNNGVEIDLMSFGPIIPEMAKDKIFDKYYRYVHASIDSDKIKGHGLGLYIAQLIANAHGFKIKYHSNSSSSTAKNGTLFGENHFSFSIPFTSEK